MPDVMNVSAQSRNDKKAPKGVQPCAGVQLLAGPLLLERVGLLSG